MLSRICLIVAILAGLAVAGLNFVKIKETIVTLKENLASEISQKEEAQKNLASTKKELDKTGKELTAAKEEITTLTDARDKAIADAETQTKRAGKLSEDLAQAKQSIADAQAELAAWSALGLKPEQVRGLQAELKQSQADYAALTDTNKKNVQKIKSLQAKVDKYEGGEGHVVPLPPELQGRVLVADPKWDFVVLNVGQNQGVLEDGILLVNRNGKLVAKVQVRSVQPDRCVANVLPNWKLGEVMEGDLVFP